MNNIRGGNGCVPGNYVLTNWPLPFILKGMKMAVRKRSTSHNPLTERTVHWLRDGPGRLRGKVASEPEGRTGQSPQ